MDKNKAKNILYFILIIFSLLILINPNVSVIDIFPDFIAYFIISRMLIFFSDRAPYFEEARIAFRRLGFLNVLKFFGLFVMIAVKRENFSDNDIIPLVTITFAAVESVLLVIAAKNLFAGIFHIGERTAAEATIKKFSILGIFRMRPETFAFLTHVFSVTKCALYFLPTLFVLTRLNGAGTSRLRLSEIFPIFLILAILLALIIGAIWAFFAACYAFAIFKEKKIFDAANLLAAQANDDILAKEKMRKQTFALNSLIIASFFTIEFTLVESYDVNLLPRFIYAAIMIFAVIILAKYAKYSVAAIVFGFLYFVTATLSYIIETSFLISYGYERLLSSAAARSAYIFVDVSAVIEFFSLALFLFFVFKMLSSFATKNTGLLSNRERMRGDDAYFGRLNLKNILMLSSGILVGLIKLISVILHGAVKIVYTDKNDITQPTIIAPAIPWIGLAVFVCSAIYIGCTIYYISTLKDEIKLKNE